MKRGTKEEDEQGEKQKRRRRLLAVPRVVGDDGQNASLKRLVKEAKSQEGDDGDSKRKAADQGRNNGGEQQESDESDVGYNESMEASDVALVPIIRSKSPKAQAKKEDQPETPTADDEVGHDATHPNPKNFAERLLNALEKGIGSEVIGWVGEGMAVAIHPKNLKNDPLLETHFKVKNYGAFIRNCNRWGFQRVNLYSVPDGQVTYQCSLFRKDQPHLVKHMRMDSDVQDVFARHGENNESTENSNLSFPQALQHQMADSKPAAVSVMSVGLQQHQPIGMSVHFQRQQQPQPSQQLISSLMDQIAQSNQGNSQGPGLLGQPQPQQDGNLLSTLLSSLLSGQGGANAAQAASDPTRIRDTLFAQILQLSGEYLRRPASDSPTDATIRTVLQLLQYNKAQSMNGQLQLQHQSVNQSHPFASAQQISAFSPVDVAADVTSRLQALLSANNSQHQAHAPPLRENNVAPASMLQQFLLQHGEGNSMQMQPAAASLPPRQQQPNAHHLQQAPNLQELMWMLLQQQQNQQSGN